RRSSDLGFTDGLVPPTAGCAWQPAQLSRLNLGPRPGSVSSPSIVPPWTDCTSLKASRPASKNSPSKLLRPSIGLPAPGGSPRTPGSVAMKPAYRLTDAPNSRSARIALVIFILGAIGSLLGGTWQIPRVSCATSLTS